jgi:hypothetical protein
MTGFLSDNVVSVSRDSAVGNNISLRTGGSGDRIPVGGKIFRTRPGRFRVYSASYALGNGAFGRSVTLTTRPYLVPRLKEE